MIPEVMARESADFPFNDRGLGPLARKKMSFLHVRGIVVGEDSVGRGDGDFC